MKRMDSGSQLEHFEQARRIEVAGLTSEIAAYKVDQCVCGRGDLAVFRVAEDGENQIGCIQLLPVFSDGNIIGEHYEAIHLETPVPNEDINEDCPGDCGNRCRTWRLADTLSGLSLAIKTLVNTEEEKLALNLETLGG